MNLIQSELENSRVYDLERDGKLVKLTPQNVAIVEAMVRADSNYTRLGDINQYPGKDGRPGSVAFWMTQLKLYLEGEKTEYSREDIISNAVIAVDRENSTHLNADKKQGRKVITDRIRKLSDDDLISMLKYPKETCYKLIMIIAERTTEEKGGRVNVSFASKFCHYACFWLFEGKTEQDNYSIYDNVVRKALPAYLVKYNLPKFKLLHYAEYQAAVDALLEKSGNLISRNGLDHLLWYGHKGE